MGHLLPGLCTPVVPHRDPLAPPAPQCNISPLAPSTSDPEIRPTYTTWTGILAGIIVLGREKINSPTFQANRRLPQQWDDEEVLSKQR